jgi:hypothetical protein
MSIFVSRPKVNKIAIAQVPPQAVRAAKLIASLRPQLNEASRTALSQIDDASMRVPHLVSDLDFRQRVSLPDTLASLEKLKTATIVEIASAPSYIADADGFRVQLGVLMQTRSVDEATRERKKLLAEVQASHRSVFVTALEQACARAAVAAGFGTVEQTRGPLGDRRLIATDDQGRGIIAEIRTDPKGNVALASEIIGVKDNSCHKLMERFEEELERLGVQAVPPERRATNGIAQLAAARDFLRTKVDATVRRARRLNQRMRGKVAQ